MLLYEYADVTTKVARTSDGFSPSFVCNRAAETSSDVPESVAETRLAGSVCASPSYGVAYLYDAELLARRIGPEFACELKSVRRLLSSLRYGTKLTAQYTATQCLLLDPMLLLVLKHMVQW